MNINVFIKTYYYYVRTRMFCVRFFLMIVKRNVIIARDQNMRVKLTFFLSSYLFISLKRLRN